MWRVHAALRAEKKWPQSKHKTKSRTFTTLPVNVIQSVQLAHRHSKCWCWLGVWFPRSQRMEQTHTHSKHIIIIDMYVRTYIYVCVYMYIHTHTQVSNSSSSYYLHTSLVTTVPTMVRTLAQSNKILRNVIYSTLANLNDLSLVKSKILIIPKSVTLIQCHGYRSAWQESSYK